MRQKIVFGARQIWMTGGLLFGAAVAFFSRGGDVRAFAGGFAHAFPAQFSLEAIERAILWQFLPLVLLFFAGWMLCCASFCTLLLTLRSAVCGYICCGIFAAIGEKNAGSVIPWVFLVFFEFAAIFCMNSMARLAQKYMNAAKKDMKKAPIKRYFRDQSFFAGLVFLLYLLRGTAVLILSV